MTYYAALDVGVRRLALCIVDGDGEVQLEQSLPSEVDDIVTCLCGFGSEIAAVGLEAGTLTQWLTWGLREAGFQVVVMEARHVKAALGAMRNKTDRNDARGIAQILRTGWYREVHVKSLESHYIRTLLASRKALLRKCIDLENEVRGLLKVFGIKLRAGIRHGAFDAAAREPVQATALLSHALMPLLDVRLELYHAFLELDRRVRALAHGDDICLLLMTTPGVGYITALTFRAAVDDPRRFRRSKTVAAHFGLTPRRHQSGERDNPGRIFQSRRYRGQISALCGRQHHPDPIHQMVISQGMGHTSGALEGTQTRPRCNRPQARRHPACHVDRRHALLASGAGGGIMN